MRCGALENRGSIDDHAPGTYAMVDFYLGLQWSAMTVTVAASWLVTSKSKLKRNIGFWTFLVSNGLWIAWGWHDGASALVVLQLFLAAINIRGADKTENS